MNLSLDLYKVFYFVCKHMSITGASYELYVSQPAVTKHIKNLEEALGKVLFVRNKKGLELTNEGLELYNEIKEPIEKLLEIDNNKKEYPTTFRIIAGYSTIKNYLLRVVSKYNEIHPEIHFELHSYKYHESIEMLKDGKADLIFSNLKNYENNDFDSLNVKLFSDVQDVFIVNKEYAKEIPDKIKLIDLDKYPVICKDGKSIGRGFVEEYFEERGKVFKPKYELSNNWLMEEYIGMNLGIGLVTKEFVEKKLKSGDFVEIVTDVELPKRQIGYAYRKHYAYKQFIYEFIEELKKSF